MTHWIIGGIIVIALAVGGFFLINQGGSVMEGDTMQDDAAMMKKDAMKSGEAMQESNGGMQKDDTMMKDGMMEKGSYESYASEKLAKANAGDVVLFFRASWCPTCKVLDTDLRANSMNIPAGLTILDVNYDTETSLKQKYGVTYQHTLVQVDAQGNMITKWSGGQNLASIVANVR